MKSWVNIKEQNYVNDPRWKEVGKLHSNNEVGPATLLVLDILIDHDEYLRTRPKYISPRTVLKVYDPTIWKEFNTRLDVYDMRNKSDQ